MKYWALPLILTALCSVGCPKKQIPEGEAPKLMVVASIPPLAHLLDQLRWDELEVEVLLNKGASPAVASPDAALPPRAAHARLLFRLKLPFEKPLVSRLKDAASELDLVDAADGIELQRRGGGALPDPHVWLDPTLAKTIARNMAEALIDLNRRKKMVVEANLATLLAELDELDRELAAMLSPIKGSTIHMLHPALGYFCKRYGLRQKSMGVWDRAPDKAALGAYLAQAAEGGAVALFAQSFTASKGVTAAISRAGLRVVALDALARDYMAGMRDIATALRENMRGEMQPIPGDEEPVILQIP